MTYDDDRTEERHQGSQKLFWTSRIVFFVGAAVFLASLPLPWEGVEHSQGGRLLREAQFNALTASEEVLATMVLGMLCIVIAACTIRNRGSWITMLASIVEMTCAAIMLVLIFVHGSRFLEVRNLGGGLLSITQRVIGPYVGMVAAVLMLVGSGLKLVSAYLVRSGEPARREQADDKPARRRRSRLADAKDDEDETPPRRSR